MGASHESPRPWSVEEDACGFAILDANGVEVCWIERHGYAPGEPRAPEDLADEANARLIVRAVNGTALG